MSEAERTSKQIDAECEKGIALRHSHVEQAGDKLKAARDMAYLSHLDRAVLLAEIERLRNALAQSIATVKRLMAPSPGEVLSSNLVTELEDVARYLSEHGTPDMGYDEVVERAIKALKSSAHETSGEVPSADLPVAKHPIGAPVDCIYCGNLRGDTHADDCPRSSPATPEKVNRE
jgi:hypothetical protein